MKPAFPVLFSSFMLLFSAAAPAASDQLSEPSAGAIKLPRPVSDGKISLERALTERRSVRQYRDIPLSLSDLAQLLWAAQGVTGAGGRRTVPSAGALYPLDVSVAAVKVTGLSAGIYSYDPGRHELRMTAKGDARSELSKAAMGQSTIKDAAAVVVLSAVYERTTAKYGERGIRYVHMEAGHAAQNVYLQATALDLGTVAVGAFDDSEVREVMHMTAREHPLYLMPVGKR